MNDLSLLTPRGYDEDDLLYDIAQDIEAEIAEINEWRRAFYEELHDAQTPL